MNLLLRILLLVCCACLPMRAAVAHEHGHARVASADSMRMAAVSARTTNDRDVSAAMHQVAGAQVTHATHPTDDDCGCPHGPYSCCATACGMHCCALPVGFAFDARAPGATRLRSEPAALHDSLTHAPRLRPPIV